MIDVISDHWIVCDTSSQDNRDVPIALALFIRVSPLSKSFILNADQAPDDGLFAFQDCSFFFTQN